MKIVYPVCAGLDVHKREIVATIATTNSSGITTYRTRKFPTFTSDLNLLADWLLSCNCRHACMESTGKYFIPVFRIFEKRGLKPCVSHPKFVRAIPGKKTDSQDNKWIADLFKHGLVPLSFIPPREIFELRDLTRYRTKLVHARSSEKNRIQNSLTVSNIMLSSVVSDTFGTAASNILKFVLDHPGETVDYSKFMSKRMKASVEDITKAMNGEFSPEQASKTKIAFMHFDQINECLAKVDAAISLLSKPYESQIKLLTTIPGVTTFSAIRIIAEIGADMSVFQDSKHLCSWAGLTPQNNESAGKKKSTRISRAGTWLKPLLIQVALGAVRNKKTYFAYKFQVLSKRRGKKKAIIAIARMILTSAYQILKKNVAFDQKLYEEYQRKETGKYNNVSIPRMVSFLAEHGFSVLNNNGEILTKAMAKTG